MAAPRLDRLDSNLLHNGNFDFWQRNTSQSTSVGSTFASVDRWRPSVNLTGGVGTLSRSTNVPNDKSKYSMRFQVTTAQVSLGTNDAMRFVQFVEGNFLKNVIGKDVTLAFYFRTNKAGTYGIAIQNVNAVRTYVSQFVVTNAEATNQDWVKRVFTVPLESMSWATDNSRSMSVLVTLADNTTATLSPNINQWAAGSFTWAAGQVNLMDTLGNYAEMSQAMMIEGVIEDPDFCLAGRSYADELQLCQRYFEKSYELNTTPGGVGVQAGVIITPQRTTDTSIGNLLTIAYCYFKVRKRASPIVTIYSYNGVLDRVSNQAGTDLAANSGKVDSLKGESSFRVRNESGGALGANEYLFHWIAEAEL